MSDKRISELPRLTPAQLGDVIPAVRNNQTVALTAEAIALLGRGPKGDRGPVGQTGPQGPEGAAGPEGPIGKDGPQGIRGPAGMQGIQGPIGPRGLEGEAGPAGPMGPVGPQGVPGPRGYQGVQGPRGEVGAGVKPNGFGNLTESVLSSAEALQEDFLFVVNPDGDDRADKQQPASLSGDQGGSLVGWSESNGWVSYGPFVGIMGPAGADGVQGPTGEAGPQGPEGPQGLKGDAGPQGPKGDAGEAGPQGPAGAQGDRGDAGPTGPRGPQGPEGPQGQIGPEGPAGPKGEDGQGLPGGGAGVDGQVLTRDSSSTSGTKWVDPPADPEWGNIGGDIAAQSDLVGLLGGKAGKASANRFTATQTFGASLVESRVQVSGSSLNLASGNYFTLSASGTITLSLANAPTDGVICFVLDVSSSGSATVNLWEGIEWANGTPPSLTEDGRDVFGFIVRPGGTSSVGVVISKDAK